MPDVQFQDIKDREQIDLLLVAVEEIYQLHYKARGQEQLDLLLQEEDFLG